MNVILIGEMRNPALCQAMLLPETGHLVFSTLHTNTAAQTVDRIVDSFPAAQQDQIRVQLASSLLGFFHSDLFLVFTDGRIPAYELLINNNML